MDVIAYQDGIVTRSQALEHVTEQRLRSRLADGRWQHLHRGVYATFSGPLTWRHQAWGALLLGGDGAALGFEAAAHLGGFGVRAPTVVDVIIPAERRVAAVPRIRVHRRAHLSSVVHGRPRRTEPAETVLDLVTRAATPCDVVAAITGGVRAGANPDVVLHLMERRWRQRWRALVTDVLSEAEEGIESPLEWRYRHDVERAHRLPGAELQVVERLPFGVIRADARYRAFNTRVELDGALRHPGGRTDRDTWRDNVTSLASGDLTLRYRWQHVVGTPCATAAQVAQALSQRGWDGSARRCRNSQCVVDSDALPADANGAKLLARNSFPPFA